MKTIVILSILIISQNSTPLFGQAHDSIPNRKMIIGTSVFEYFPGLFLHTGNFNLDAEFQLKNQWSLSTNLGYVHSYKKYFLNGFLEPTYRFSSIIDPAHGTRIQLEIRRYSRFKKIFEPACILIWPHMFQYNTVPADNSGYYAGIHTYLRYLFIGVKTPFREIKPNNISGYAVNTGLHLKFGYRNITPSGYTMDLGLGFGLQYLESDYELKGLIARPGIQPSVTYQIKLGWGFKKQH